MRREKNRQVRRPTLPLTCEKSLSSNRLCGVFTETKHKENTNESEYTMAMGQLHGHGIAWR